MTWRQWHHSRAFLEDRFQLSPSREVENDKADAEDASARRAQEALRRVK